MLKNLSIVGLTVATLIAPVWAHDLWLKPDGGAAVLIYGHSDDSDPYKKEIVKSVLGWTPTGKKHEVSQAWSKDQLKLQGAGVSSYAIEIDNGYWTKTIQGWKNRSKKEEPKAIKSTWDRAFAKLVDARTPGLVAGQPLEIVLSSATPEKIDGQVLLRGKPAAGIAIEQDHKKLATTDSAGKFSFKPGKGLIVMKAHQQEKLEGNANADFLNLDSTLTVKL